MENFRNRLTSLSLVALILFFVSIHNSYAQQSPDWITESNKHSMALLEVIANHQPEDGARLGVDGFDENIVDMSAGFDQRFVNDLEKVTEYLQDQYNKTQNVPVKQDINILLESAANSIEEIRLEDAYLLPYHNVSGLVYNGIKNLLQDRIPAERRQAALIRLKKYAGVEPGYRPVAELAREHMKMEWKNSSRMAPFQEQVARDLNVSRQFIDEIGDLFEKYEISGYETVYEKLKDQIEAYNKYLQEDILPNTRTEFQLPKEIYIFNLSGYGVDMPVDELKLRASVAFKELQTQMQVLANLIAAKNGFTSSDYRDVIRSLKKQQLDSSSILPYYQERIKDIEEIIRRERLLTMPERDMVIRLATRAESAAAPAPFMSPPRLIGNTGEYGEFVLPLSATGGADGTSLKIDDFTNAAASWPLTAHEGRPGHELQYTAIIERGVSQARVIFARNSVNVEGWALYAEEIVQPYIPLEGQFMTLWSRLVRAGRAFLDPGLNLGTITSEEARYVLANEIVLSEAMVRSELERYRFRAPGQATSYFNGYLRLMEMRAETELLLAGKFSPLDFHDFILAQGLLTPALIREALLQEFIPSQMQK
jgi:hypothetical protein